MLDWILSLILGAFLRSTISTIECGYSLSLSLSLDISCTLYQSIYLTPLSYIMHSLVSLPLGQNAHDCNSRVVLENSPLNKCCLSIRSPSNPGSNRQGPSLNLVIFVSQTPFQRAWRRHQTLHIWVPSKFVPGAILGVIRAFLRRACPKLKHQS